MIFETPHRQRPRGIGGLIASSATESWLDIDEEHLTGIKHDLTWFNHHLTNIHHYFRGISPTSELLQSTAPDHSRLALMKSQDSDFPAKFDYWMVIVYPMNSHENLILEGKCM